MPEVAAGVIGVGSMGQNHARVYRELPGTTLDGIYDADPDRARDVADEYDTTPRSMDELLTRADVVSVAVPTEYHYDTVRECIDAGVHVLVEKPLVGDPATGRKLVEFARDRDVTLQVGHIERFNPVTQKLLDIVDDLDIIGVDARRLGPPVDRDIDDTAVMDLMVHDIDVLTTIVDSPLAELNAIGSDDLEYAKVNLQFESGVVSHLTASRVTQEKERSLSITAADCRVKVDYIDQAITVHRQSLPEYVEEDGAVTHHHESVVEQLSVSRGEPLKEELRSFVEAAVEGRTPAVTAADGLRVLELARAIEQDALGLQQEDTPIPTR